ncbi:hypothetical protein HZC53_03990 [Candidatus Uhrbacteria bacterium]|nr:hypothetical protein [Candidatus Uhrbacteria bacterium]
MPTQPKITQPAYLLAGVLFTVIALVAIISLFMLRSKADVTTQEAYPGNAAPNVDSLYVAETSQGIDIGPAGIGDGFTTNEGAPKTIYVGGQLSDMNGCHNLMQATVTLYRSDIPGSQSCTSDTNNCYHTTLYPEDFVGCDTPDDTNVTFETSFSMPNYVDPTDAGSPYEGVNWLAYVNVADNAEEQTVFTETFEVNSLAAFSVPNAINYGSVALGADSNAIQLTFSNTGNRNVDSDVIALHDPLAQPTPIEGDMVSNLSGFDNISASAVHYSLSALTAYESATAVSKTASTDLALGLLQQTDDLTIPTTDTYWKLRMPASGVQGTYTNVVVFTAKAAATIGALDISSSLSYASSDGVNVSYMDVDSNSVYVTAENSNTLMVVDMSDSANPVELTTLSNTLANETAIEYNGDHLILSSESATNNFQIIDVSVPATPTIVSTITAISGGVKDVAYDGFQYAYVVGGTDKFVIVDMSNPASPTVVPGSTLTIDYPVTGVERFGSTVYVYAMDSVSSPAHGYLYTINASTPGSPVILDTLQTHTDAKIFASTVGEQAYVFVAGNNSDFANSIQMVSAQDPSNLGIVGNESINTNTPSSMKVYGNYLYVTDNGEEVGSDNIHVLNISDPANISIVASTRLGAYNAAGTVYTLGGVSLTNVYVSGRADGVYYVLWAPTPPVGGGGKAGGGAK